MFLSSWGIEMCGSFHLCPTQQARPSAPGDRVTEPTRHAQSGRRSRIVDIGLGSVEKGRTACTFQLHILFSYWKLVLSPRQVLERDQLTVRESSAAHPTDEGGAPAAAPPPAQWAHPGPERVTAAPRSVPA